MSSDAPIQADRKESASNLEDIVEEGDERHRSIISNIIQQLRKTPDLHRISLPTFILEPRSMVFLILVNS